MNIDEYLAGIRRAADEGLIEYVRKECRYFGESTPFSHLPEEGCLCGTNTRRLAPEARAILKHLAQEMPVRMLELGPGAGVAAYEAAALRTKYPVNVMTVSLTPTNPYVKHPYVNTKVVEKAVHVAADFPTMKRDFTRVRAHLTHCDISLEDALLLDEITGSLGFATGEPFCKQVIGRFPYETCLTGEKFELIYDSYGLFLYVSKTPDVLKAVLRLLAPEGVFYSRSCFQRLAQHGIPTGFVAAKETQSSQFVLTRRDSIVGRFVRARERPARRIVTVTDLFPLLISRAASPRAAARGRSRRT